MKKYLGGGRCFEASPPKGGRCGGTSSFEKKDTQGVNQAFSNMLAERDAFVNNLYKPTSNTNANIPNTNIPTQQNSISQNSNTQLVVKNKNTNSLLKEKEKAIEFINSFSLSDSE